MSDKEKPTPDYGSSLIWSTDKAKAFKAGVAALLKKHNGDIDSALKALFEAGGTSYEEGRRLSLYAEYFGLTDVEFMTKFRRWRRGEKL